MKRTYWSKWLALAAAVTLLASCFGCSTGGGSEKTPGPTLSVPKNKESSWVEINLIPAPKELYGTVEDGKYQAYEYDPQIRTEVEDWTGAVDSFRSYVSKLYDVSLEEGQNGIVLQKDESLAAGSYQLISGDVIKLLASDEDGIQYGLSTLMQIIEPSDNGIFVPLVQITDAGDSGYRGLMVDLARNWHEPDMLFDYVDLCYFYKVSILHLHFTDSQSYTLPCETYPDLPSDSRRYSHYSKELIQELVEYAHARGVTLMPEIETPGHYDSFKAAYPEIFGSKGIMCMHETTFQALEKIFGELCDMFPYSPYIHIGGDEAAIDLWLTCSDCMAYAKDHDLLVDGGNNHETAEKMYAHFVQRMAQIVFDKGRRPVVWEGFAKEYNDMVSKDVLVMSWENYYQPTQDLLAAGFEILNCSWSPMYIVIPGTYWPQEEVFNWSIYKWKPVHGLSPSYPDGFTIEPNNKVLGGQVLAWGDGILNNLNSFSSIRDALLQEFDMIQERVPAMAEKTWNVGTDLSYEEFQKTYEKTSALMKRLLAD